MNRIIFSLDEFKESSEYATIEELMSECCLSEADESIEESNGSELAVEDHIDELDEEEEDDYEEEMTCIEPKADTQIPLLKKSLFIGGEDVFNFPKEGQTVVHSLQMKFNQLRWKAGYAPKIVKALLRRSGFEIIKSKDWFGYWGKHLVVDKFKRIHPFQKLNHFPMSFEVGRKDRMYMNYEKMKSRLSKADKIQLNYCPKTFMLPRDRRQLKREFTHHPLWIIKPPASARGIGIKLISHWRELPKKKSIIVSEYISNPLLIKKRKFDLRIYVLVTNFDPLRIYIYEHGIVRFATDPYQSHGTKRYSKNRFMHLTNHSISRKKRKNPPVTSPEDEFEYKDYKWDLQMLQEYMESRGMDYLKIKAQIRDIVIKTMISVHAPNVNGNRTCLENPNSCYELFGFDILIDSNLKPWLMEVNISPSLKTSGDIDQSVKSKLIVDIFNLAGYSAKNAMYYKDHYNSKKSGSVWKKTLLTMSERKKHREVLVGKITNVLADLTNDDISVLKYFEDENDRKGSFELAFPSRDAPSYDRYFQFKTYYDRLLGSWITSEPNTLHRIDKLFKISPSISSSSSSIPSDMTSMQSKLGIVPRKCILTRPRQSKPLQHSVSVPNLKKSSELNRIFK